jgi:hypothetical protein
MFMPNIPRRKIYEKMLEFEDCLITMQILIQNEENFQKYKEKFKEETIPPLKKTILELKALLILFLENKKYYTPKEYEDELMILINEKNKSHEKLISNPNFNKDFKECLIEILKIDDIKEIKNLKSGKDMFRVLDKFNSHIPKILQLKRDKMK